MLIVCPRCESRYDIEATMIAAEGRAVRCARCRAEWTVYPDQNGTGSEMVDEWSAAAPIAAVEDPASAAPRVLHGVPDLGAMPQPSAEPPPVARAVVPESVEEIAARRAAPRKAARPRRHRRILPRARTVAAAAAVLAVAAAVGLRQDVVRALPATARLYAGVGLPVNLRGLDFLDVRTSRASEGDLPVLVVEGSIRNITRAPVAVPPLMLAIRDDKEAEIYRWTAAPAASLLQPGATLPFRSRLASPPAEGRSVAVRFVRPQDRPAGSQ